MCDVRSYSSTMQSKWEGAAVFVTLAFICFLLYHTIGNVWLFPHSNNSTESGVDGTQTTTLSPKTTTHADRELLYEERRRDVIKGCKKVNRTVKNSFNFNRHNLVFEKKHFIYYCPITKVSSTFWKRVLTVMVSQGRLNSPFEITLGQVKLSKWNEISEGELKILKENGTSFMFVRDPYARLFSGYENKIYLPNLLFWKITGRDVVRVVRGNREKVYKNYGFDVTFPEFIKYTLHQYDSGKHVNEHFSPMVNHCDPCSIRFQYIGKLETIVDDAIYLISKWRREFNDFNLHFDDFEKETVLDSARGHINFLFETKKVLKEINFPFIKLMLRTWRDLQLRGFLSKYIKFPFNNTDVDKITKDAFKEAIKNALNIPVNPIDVKKQRDEALIQAYRQVPMEDMERLRMYLLKDCLLFGYDDRPLKLFDRSNPLTNDFLYLDGLKSD